MLSERGKTEINFYVHGPLNVAALRGNGSPPKSILLVRSGAIGDLLLLTPCFEALRKAHPQAKLTLSCFTQHHPIVSGIDLIEYPVHIDKLKDFDLIIPLEDVIEQSTEDGLHATDAYANYLNVTVRDYAPVYAVTEEETLLAKLNYHKGDKPRVGIQLHASSIVRGYPMQQWNAVMVSLIKRGWEIMLLGKQDKIQGAPKEIHDCSGLTFREAAAVLASCDVFCGVDSSFFNLCPALKVPAIGLFGPVGWRTRIKEESGQHALSVAADCAPCGWTNSQRGKQWPTHGPCAKTGRCEPLAAITPERIVAKIDAYRK